MNLTDDEIRAALLHVASRAPDPAAVRAHLADLTRRHRQRRALLLAGGAVGAAVAIGGPAVVLSRRPSARPSAAEDLPDVRTWPNLPPATPEPTPGPGNGRVPLLFRPTYLPDDFLEVFRIVTMGASTYQAREWHLDRGPTVMPSAITLSVGADADISINDRSGEITVSGAPGWLAPKDAEVQQVVWSIGDGLNLCVEARHMDDGWTIVQDVARSVEPDRVAGLEVPLTFGFLPVEFTGGWRLTVEPDGDQWVATLSVIRDRAAVLEARLGAHLVGDLGFLYDVVPMELRGRPGQVALAPDGRGGGAIVGLESGLNLTVTVPGGSDPLTVDDLVRVTNAMTIGSAPYVGWIWHR